ncbi:phosphotransferase [Paenibacillus caui]|uniref:phosphotransferase n=1 Tax=Paenibacillus caui TaxID=2873927 RepID=UPI001CA9FBAC|nr:phosphotransferase [Paenibacillus caui]
MGKETEQPERLFVEQNYDIGAVEKLQKINAGRSSMAMLVAAGSGQYVLRRLRNRQQAELEYKISHKLLHFELCPPILLARDMRPFAQNEDECYNLQLYMDNDPKGSEEVDDVKLGHAIAVFHLELAALDGLPQPDRFELGAMWSTIQNRDNTDSSSWMRSLAERVQELLSFELSSSNTSSCSGDWIHGDLGKWNMLFPRSRKRSSVLLIDFGEARKGNRHFDMAAVLASLLKSCRTDEDWKRRISAFAYGYQSGGKVVDFAELAAYTEFWLIRGAVAVLAHNGTTEASARFVREVMATIDRYKRIYSDRVS